MQANVCTSNMTEPDRSLQTTNMPPELPGPLPGFRTKASVGASTRRSKGAGERKREKVYIGFLAT